MIHHPRCFALAILLTLLLATPGLAQGTATVSPTKDNTLYQDNSGGLSNGAGSRMFVGRTQTGLTRRCLVSFDVAGTIPAGSIITSADLTISVAQSSGGPLAVSLHASLADWGEGTSVASGAGGGQGNGGPSTAGDATWIHTFFPSSTWATPGGDFTATPSATLSVGGNGSYTWPSASNAAMVLDVQSWLDSPSTNFGWLLKSPETANGNARAFVTKEGVSSPVLLINYTSPPMAAVVATGAGCAGTNPAGLSLGAVGVPTLGNPSFGLSIGNGPPAGTALLYLANGIASSPIALGGGCLIYLDIPSALNLITLGASPLGPLPLDVGGGVTFFFGIPNIPALSGFLIDMQVLAPDPATAWGVVGSNALSLTIGT